jgi:2,3-bisphosphoglycerate-dependent phosphoglycerate mutase
MPLAIIRHGQSEWNLENRFTGWIDVDLSDEGISEAKLAAVELIKSGLQFDVAYTSVLKRAIRTLWIIMDEMDLMWLPVNRTWRLNERHYGDLIGLNKIETAEKYGIEQVQTWRRSYTVRPGELKPDDPRSFESDRRYSGLKIPRTESLKDTLERVIPIWGESVKNELKSGKNVLLVAHGNSCRALVKYIDNLSDEEINEFNIPTGIPLIYEFDQDVKPLNHYYLGDPEEITKRTNAVANQAKKEN